MSAYYKLLSSNLPGVQAWFTHDDPSRFIDLQMYLPGTTFLDSPSPIRAGGVEIPISFEQMLAIAMWTDSHLTDDGLSNPHQSFVSEAVHTDPVGIQRHYFAHIRFAMGVLAAPYLEIGLQERIAARSVPVFRFNMAKTSGWSRLTRLILGKPRHDVIAESLEPLAVFLSKSLHREITHE